MSTDFSHLEDTTIDFYREDDGYVNFECSDGTINDATLAAAHDDLVVLLDANGAGEWTYGEIHCYPSRNELYVQWYPMDYELSNESVIDYRQFKQMVEAFDDLENAAEVLSGLTSDSYADLVTEDPDNRQARTYYHALNPQLIAGNS